VTTFATELRWKSGKQADLNARDNPSLRVATPPDFGGPARTWCPEELFVGSIESCLMSTFLYFVQRFDMSLAAYSSSSRGVLNKTAQGLRFARVEVRIDVAWEDDESLRKAVSLHLREKLEKYCPISASLNCPVSIYMEMRKPGGEGQGNRAPENWLANGSKVAAGTDYGDCLSA
jgi:organic hydroperoxide reductase OsmC/OhrA